jgi:hypothetical protein
MTSSGRPARDAPRPPSCSRGVMMSSGSPAREKRTPRPPICSLNKCVKAKPNGHRAGSFAYAHRHYTILPVCDIGALASSFSACPKSLYWTSEVPFPWNPVQLLTSPLHRRRDRDQSQSGSCVPASLKLCREEPPLHSQNFCWGKLKARQESPCSILFSLRLECGRLVRTPTALANLHGQRAHGGYRQAMRASNAGGGRFGVMVLSHVGNVNGISIQRLETSFYCAISGANSIQACGYAKPAQRVVPSRKWVSPDSTRVVYADTSTG